MNQIGRTAPSKLLQQKLHGKIHASILLKKNTQNILKKHYLKHLKPGECSTSPQYFISISISCSSSFSASVVLIKHTSATISIYHSETAKYANNYLKIQRIATKKLFYIFVRHKMIYGYQPMSAKSNYLLVACNTW